MNKKEFLLVLCFSLIFSASYAQQIQGTIKDTKGEPLPFASIYVKDATLGTASDVKGRYIFDLDTGHYTLVFSYLGFKSLEKSVALEKGQVKMIDVVLDESPTELGEVQVIANSKSAAKSIMNKVRKNRKKYLHQLKTYSCETYVKKTLDRKLIHPHKSDTLLVVKSNKKLSKRKKRKLEEQEKQVKENRDAFFDKNNLQLIESVSELYFKAPKTFKEKIIAKHDYSNRYTPTQNVAVSFYGGSGGEIAPYQWVNSNPYLIYSVTDPDFNFYRNTIAFPSICSKPVLSPLASTANLNYTYDFQGSFMEDGHKVFKIAVQPRFQSDALFRGILFIEDSTFALKSVDLSINPPAMFGAQDFKILQNYEWQEGHYTLPVRREIIYTIKEGKNHFIGNVSVRHTHYKINPPLPKRFFNRQVKTYATDAFEKDSLFWERLRPVTFKASEIKFIVKADSIKQYHESPEYKRKQDSIYNHIGLVDVLLNGFGHKDRSKGYTFWFDPLIEQINLVGIGGYRHRLGGGLLLEFPNNQMLHFDGMVDYGFRNQDVKGRVGIGFTFLPKKFMRTFIRFGDFYDQINNYESVQAIFSRSNYVRTKTYSIEQKMEVVNGLFAELTLKHADQIPITGLQLSQWSKDVFGASNTPKEFPEYKKTEVKLRLQYRPFQKFYYFSNKKVIVGSDWPEFFLEYRKGLKGVLGSEVDYDYIQLGVKDYRKMGRWGYANWMAEMGSFVNHRNLRFLEYNFFRGSDQYLFSNPVTSFQLLGPTLNTRNEFFRAHFIHHFEGTLLNKIPLVHWLKLELAGGAGSLLIRDIQFAHAEIFAGIERKVKLFDTIFRFGIYGVSADNSLDPARLTFKIGANVYDDYARKWEY